MCDPQGMRLKIIHNRCTTLLLNRIKKKVQLLQRHLKRKLKIIHFIPKIFRRRAGKIVQPDGRMFPPTEGRGRLNGGFSAEETIKASPSSSPTVERSSRGEELVAGRRASRAAAGGDGSAFRKGFRRSHVLCKRE